MRFAGLLFLCFTPSLFAYPEFQAFISRHSGRTVNCAFCHSNSDGPEGRGAGQIGGLSAEELTALGEARAAIQPGVAVHSPILNAFGNHVIHSVGKLSFLETRQDPLTLSQKLPADSDLDRDGIPDVREFLEGTHPLNPVDGNPFELFKHNLFRSRFDILMIILATVAGVFGLTHLVRGFERMYREEEPGDGR